MSLLDSMMKVCAPARDDTVRALIKRALQSRLNHSLLTEILRDTFVCLDQMHIDLANYHLNAIKPSLKTVAVDYEREKFGPKLASGEISLEKTKAWLTEARKIQAGEALSSNDVEGIFLRGVTNLVLSPVAPVMPEVLALDEEILLSTRYDVRRLILVASIMTFSKNLVPELRDPAFGGSEIQQKMVYLLKDAEVQSENVSSFLTSEFSKRLTALGKSPMAPQHLALLKGLITRAFEGNDTIVRFAAPTSPSFGFTIPCLTCLVSLTRLLTRRVREYLESHAFRGKRGSDDHFRKAGLDSVKDDLVSTADKLGLAVCHSFSTFSPFCEQALS